MNRAEARIRNYQNSHSQLNPTKDMSLGNNGAFAFLNHSKAVNDKCNLARKIGRKKENYNLKPLDLKKSGINATLFDELRKCDEENVEFTQAIIKCDYDNAIEEFWDSVQTKINVMDMAGIKLEDIYAGLEKHKLKMISRGNVFKE